VLQKRAMDVTKLLLPYEPTTSWPLAAHKAAHPGFQHRAGAFLPPGRHQATADWARATGARAPAAAATEGHP
jgi:methylenetetrahydrofolate reductase (NADPH)